MTIKGICLLALGSNIWIGNQAAALPATLLAQKTVGAAADSLTALNIWQESQTDVCPLQTFPFIAAPLPLPQCFSNEPETDLEEPLLAEQDSVKAAFDGLFSGAFRNKNWPADFHATRSVSSGPQLNGDEIAEALQAEAAFTTATDKKPIVATYGAGPCVALGGYDATNKIAFMVHFSNAGEVRKSGGLIFYNIGELAKEKIEKPIQLHLRGGMKGQSEATIEAIKLWMEQRDDLPMEISTQDILASGMVWGGKSLLIDSRTGEVSEYDPLANPKHRVMSQSDVTSALLSAFEPRIRVAYKPGESVQN